MSILTITLNPCIDKSTTVAGIKPDKKLRCTAPRFEPGGGGINVSRAIHKLGGNAVALFPEGGYTGKLLTDLLSSEGIESIPLSIRDTIRENFMVVDELNNTQYRFCMPGPVLQENECKSLLEKIEAAPPADYIILSGSLPPGIQPDIPGRIAAISKNKKAKLILDSSGPAIQYALEKGVYLWKPNLGELSSFAGEAELTEKSAAIAAKEIVEKGMAEIIVISLGAAGAMLITKDINERFSAPVVHRKSTVGAGDSMVAGMALKLSKGATIHEAVTYGIACGTAATMNPGTELCKPADVENLLKHRLGKN